jgi:hypothetical protein
MRWFGFFVGLCIAALGVLGVAAPMILLDFAAFALTEAGIYVAAALRIAIGIALIAIAGTSRLPRTLRVFGALIIVVGFITPFLGIERARAIVDWWSAQGAMFMRAWAAVAVTFGLFIIYAVAPRRSAT